MAGKAIDGSSPTGDSLDLLAQIERAKREWEVTVDTLPQLVCLLDDHQRIQRANRTVEHWGLAQVVSVKGTPVHALLHPGCADPACYLPAFLTEAWQALSDGQATERPVEDAVLKRHFHLQVRPVALTVIQSLEGSSVFAAFIAQDITSRVLAEIELSRYRAHLEEMVEARTAELSQTNRALEQEITERVRAEEALKRRAAQLALLNDVGGQIAAVLELESVLDRAAHLVQESFGYHHVALFTLDREQGALAMRARAGDFAHLFPPDHRLKLGQGVVGWVGRHGETLLANDVDAEPRYVNLYPDMIPSRSELSVPITVGGEVVGVLDVQSPQLNTFDENDVMVMETLADQIAIAVENARLYAAVQQELAERKQAQEALRESEAHYKELAESISDVFFAMDKDLRYTYWNRASEELTGIPAQDAIGKSLYDLFPDTPDTKRAERVYLEVLRTQQPQSFISEYRLGDKDFFFEISVYPSTAGISVFTRDITERKRAEQVQAATYCISEAAQAAQNVDELFGLIHAIIGELMPAKNFYIVLYDASADLVHFPYFADEFDTPPPPRKSGRGLTDYVLRTGKPLLATPEVFEQLVQSGQVESVGVPSVDWLGVPLKSQQGETIGAMVVQSYTEAVRLEEADRDVLMFVSTQVAMATERKRAEEEIRRRNRELGMLNQIIAASATSAEPEAILEVACRELAQAFGMPQATAALLNEGKTEAVVAAEYFSAASEQRVTQEPLTAVGQAIPVEGNPVFQYLLSRQRSLMVDDAQNDPRLAPIHDLMRQRGTVSFFSLPLIVGSEVVGSLGLEATEPRHFSVEDINLAWSVADQVSGALARARLARTQQRLITAIEQAAESVVVTDTEATILYVNPAFERVSGYSRAEAVGQHTRTVKPGKQDGSFHQKMQAVLRAGETWQGRLVSKKKDGTLYTEEATISPVRDESGAIVSFVAVMRDVTRELQLEEQYRQAQKMEAVGQLTAGIAHDFNNLLTAINGFAELMQFQLPPDDPLQESLGKILHSGRRAADLVRQLLAFSRKQIIEPQVLDLNAVVGDMDKMLRRVIGEHIELKTILASDLWPVKVDPAQIEQVIVNLAVNARDAMPGGGHLTVETANVVLDRDYAARHLRVRAGHYVLLAVSDDGLGMSKEVKTHLFEPFFTTKEAGKGTGLGLAAVYGIVEQSGGTIWVYSEAGHGTTFKIYLPRAEGAVAPLTRSDRAGELPRGMETVLLVEDDPAVRDLVARVLGWQGYAVLEAADGQEALRLARQHRGKINLLLADVVMPGLSGMALARQLAPLQAGMKLLFMSGYADNAVVQHSILDAGVAFLQKPFSSLALARKVRQVLDAPQRESPKNRRQLEVPT